MQISAHYIDDFKTERKDLMPPLPTSLRILPILFYGAVLFLAVVGSLAMWHSRVATKRHEEIVQQEAALKTKIEQVKATRAALEVKIREAADLENWVLASMPLQPLVIGIIRSIMPGTSIVELNLERDPETPSQLKLALTLNAESDEQVEKTLDVIRGMNYREFSPTQSVVKGNIEYRASLLWRNPDAEQPTPASRAAQIQQP